MDGEGPRIAVNGFGRIGRLTVRALLSGPQPVDLVAINDPTDPDILVHLLKHDSVHGAFPGSVEATDDGMVVDGDRLVALHRADPKDIDWRRWQPDIVIEASGHFTKAADLQRHLDAGAPRVLLTAPGEADVMIVRGVNDDHLTDQATVSAASCTTNCLAPLLAVLDDSVGVEAGLMTTVHAVTGDQRLTDSPHDDLRRARASLGSMIPTKTGAAKAIGKILPHLDGRIDGQAIRVPTLDVSVIDLVVRVRDRTTTDAVADAFATAASGRLQGILGVEDEPLVSVDFVGDPRSCIVDVPSIQVVDELVKVLAWYDNEWGYANRVAELAVLMAR